MNEKRRNTYEAILKYLMPGLIYPAVLGSILYSALDEYAKQIRLLWHFIHYNESYGPDYLVTMQFSLLVITLVFYSCDFLYITFTNNYRRWLFILDLLFVLALYCPRRASTKLCTFGARLPVATHLPPC